MLAYTSKVDLEIILKECQELKSWLDGSGVLMTMQQSGGIPENLPPGIQSAINEIAALTGLKPLHLMINILPGKIEVPIHTDNVIGKPFRYHLPVVTNYNCYWWDALNGAHHFSRGFWYGPVPYHIDHRIVNYSDEERVHLIVDLT